MISYGETATRWTFVVNINRVDKWWLAMVRLLCWTWRLIKMKATYVTDALHAMCLTSNGVSRSVWTLNSRTNDRAVGYRINNVTSQFSSIYTIVPYSAVDCHLFFSKYNPSMELTSEQRCLNAHLEYYQFTFNNKNEDSPGLSVVFGFGFALSVVL